MKKSIDNISDNETSSDESSDQASIDETSNDKASIGKALNDETSDDETSDDETSSDESVQFIPLKSKSNKKTAKKSTKKTTKKTAKKSTKKSTNKEKSKKQEEKLKKQQEKLKKQEEKLAKAEEKLKKQEEKLAKEEERSKKKKKKEEEKQRKENERLAKEERRSMAKKIIEEEKQRKENEKLKKQEEKLRIEEEKKTRLMKQQNLFRSLFIKGEFLTNEQRRERNNLNTNKSIANLIPLNVKEQFNRQNFDQLINQQDNRQHYLDYLKTNLKNKKIQYSKTKSNNKIKFKLIQFHENYRPPFYGPFFKKNNTTGRKPFEKNNPVDYDVDSDEEYFKKDCSDLKSEDSERSDEEIDDDEFNDFIENDSFKKRKLNSDNLNKSTKKIKSNQLVAEENELSLVPEVIGCFFFDKNNYDIEQFKELKEYKIEFIN